MKTWIFPALLALGTLLPGCSSSPSVQYYILEPLTAPTMATIGNPVRRTIGIGPVALPALLESKKIVTRVTNNTVQIAQFHQWASPLQDNLVQTLARNLQTLQPDAVVRPYPWSVYGTVDVQVIVDVIRFEASPGKSVNLEAVWTLKNERANTVLKTGRSVIDHPFEGASYPDTVHALSLMLSEFSRIVAASINEI